MPISWSPTRRKRILLAAVNSLAALVVPLKRWRRHGQAEGNGIRQILVVELWNIGDVVLAMPFLAQLRNLFPGASITLLARRHAKELLKGTELVDEVITADLGWEETGMEPRSSENWSELLRVCRQLRRRDFDLAFHSRLHIREHAILALSGARRRVGYSFGGRDLALTDTIAVDDPDSHKIFDWMRLLRPFGGRVDMEWPRLRVSESERSWAGEFLAVQGFPPRDLVIGVHPGASVRDKRWPVERFREVAAALVKRPGTRVLAFVDPSGYGAQLGDIRGVATAQVGLRQLIALIQRCNLLVCNDSGPMHIAGALRVPTVAIFGSTVWRWFGPMGEGHQILISAPELVAPGYDQMTVPYDVSTIPTKDVLAAVERAFGEIAARARTRPTG